LGVSRWGEFKNTLKISNKINLTPSLFRTDPPTHRGGRRFFLWPRGNKICRSPPRGSPICRPLGNRQETAAGLRNLRGRQRGQDQARRWAKRALEANPPLNYLWRSPLGARPPNIEFLRLNHPNRPTHALQRTPRPLHLVELCCGRCCGRCTHSNAHSNAHSSAALSALLAIHMALRLPAW
jgi:hypothetical protein